MAGALQDVDRMVNSMVMGSIFSLIRKGK